MAISSRISSADFHLLYIMLYCCWPMARKKYWITFQDWLNFKFLLMFEFDFVSCSFYVQFTNRYIYFLPFSLLSQLHLKAIQRRNVFDVTKYIWRRPLNLSMDCAKSVLRIRYRAMIKRMRMWPFRRVIKNFRIN